MRWIWYRYHNTLEYAFVNKQIGPSRKPGNRVFNENVNPRKTGGGSEPMDDGGPAIDVWTMGQRKIAIGMDGI
jgi:hypothetical protein